MTPTGNDVEVALQRFDRQLEHPRTLAAKAVAKFRGRHEPTIPWILPGDSGAPILDVDAVITASQPNHAPTAEIRRRRRWWWR